MKTRKHGRDAIPVISPDGQYFPSMTAAAFASGVRPSTVVVNARLGRGGWRIATAQDRPAETNGGNGS